MFPDQFTDGGHIKRRGMKDHRGIVGHHEPEHHVSERMEEGEDAEHTFILIQMEHLCRALAVGVDTEMGEHDAFGFAGTAAAENDRGQAVGGKRRSLPAGPFDDAAGSEEGQQGRLKFVLRADRFCQVFQPDDRWTIRQVKLGLLNEQTAGHNGAKSRELYRGFQSGLSDRVVQIHDGLAAERSGDVHQGTGDCGWQKHADPFLFAPKRAKGSRQDN